MHKLCSTINNGYSSNYKTVKVLFKKKYIYVLDKLLKYNCINFYKVSNDSIEINLKYYNNKPIFRLKLNSTNSNKQYFKLYHIKTKVKMKNNNLNVYSTNKGFLLNDEILYKNVGGNFLIKVEFINNKTILK